MPPNPLPTPPAHTHTAAMGATHSPPLRYSWDGDSQLARSHFARTVLPNAAAAAPGPAMDLVWVALSSTPVPLPAAQGAAHARTAVLQSEACVWH